MTNLNTTYKQLLKQFKILRDINPNDNMLKYRECIRNKEVLILEASEQYKKFMNAFNIPDGTPSRFVLKECLNAVTTRIDDVQKQGGLENKALPK
jgi:hypothetical protein